MKNKNVNTSSFISYPSLKESHRHTIIYHSYMTGFTTLYYFLHAVDIIYSLSFLLISHLQRICVIHIISYTALFNTIPTGQIGLHLLQSTVPYPLVLPYVFNLHSFCFTPFSLSRNRTIFYT
jgi:hypothetical protein